MQNMKIEGIGTISSGEYDIVTFDGVGHCDGDLKARSLRVDGVATVNGNVRADTLEVDGVLTVSRASKIEATTILCDGIITTDGEISADRIEADGSIKSESIVGDSISIHSRARGLWLFGFGRHAASTIKLIEATNVELRGVKAETVNGKNVTIGRGCEIERVDCSGNLCVDRNAKVGTITGTYTRS